MFEFIKNIFICHTTNQPQTEQANSSVNSVNNVNNVNHVPFNSNGLEDINVHVHKKTPACSYCQSVEHNIIKCVQVKTQLEKIKTYCSDPAHQQNVIETTNWLKNFDNRVLARYIITHNINSYMWNNCAVYYSNNIDRTSGKEKNIQLIIGFECVLPAHPEIRIKREQKSYLKSYNKNRDYNQSKHHNSGLSGGNLLGASLIMSTGIAAGYAIAELK